ncbi:hypothetical protein EII17_11690 [Clostridiales bacterium COT073_COT-073]|nr:hypothetical protein EII17_11690 [Clostridiales bacterium COT073_COT-073]
MGMIIAFILFFIAIYGLIARRNIIKAIIAFGIMESAIILYFLGAHHERNAVPPLLLGQIAEGTAIADPLPQALMITSIVIGVSVTAVGLTMFISLYYHYGTTNWLKVAIKRKEEK